MRKNLKNSLWNYLTLKMLPACARRMAVTAEVALAQTANHVDVHIALDNVGTEVAF